MWFKIAEKSHKKFFFPKICTKKQGTEINQSPAVYTRLLRKEFKNEKILAIIHGYFALA